MICYLWGLRLNLLQARYTKVSRFPNLLRFSLPATYCPLLDRSLQFWGVLPHQWERFRALSLCRNNMKDRNSYPFEVTSIQSRSSSSISISACSKHEEIGCKKFKSTTSHRILFDNFCWKVTERLTCKNCLSSYQWLKLRNPHKVPATWILRALKGWQTLYELSSISFIGVP